MDDEQLRRIAWNSIAAFQRVIGTYASSARLTDNAHCVASAVPGLPSSLINSAVPIDGASLAPHLDEIEAFYADSPKWGAWLTPPPRTTRTRSGPAGSCSTPRRS